ncbi:MAG TPA: hypothetical protein VKH19_18135 [Gemmatimonadaceae bacterium]|nr:hypothetical protein [Gemmatimonadaceae bacterium]
MRYRFSLLAYVACASTAGAQQWNDTRALDLVRQATERRAQQLADSGLVDYQATAHGYLTFLAQLGEGYREPPKVVKADELALQVYWRAPNLSKQVVVGRRDTTVLPTDIQYHRDHLGIVQNNFPAIIRLGEGDEVRDVPHPLSVAGVSLYDFAITDSLRITIPGRTIEVYEVKVRPRDDAQPRLIGALYLDRESGQVVRMAFSFTRASFLDKQLEDLFIVLENGLVGTRFWLPRHQEVEIRRTATWLDYPVRGIIRGRWEIGEYQFNKGLASAQFAGPEIVFAPANVQRAYPWPRSRILDSLPPDVRAVTADEIRRVQAETRSLVREQALRRARGSAIWASGISDFARFNRVEGVALGGGAKGAFGGGMTATAGGRYGFADRAAKGSAGVRWENGRGRAIQLTVSHDHGDLGDVPERSRAVNSIAAQEAGSDFTDELRQSRAAVGFTAPIAAQRITVEIARERDRPLELHATPGAGRFEPPAQADSLDAWRARLTVDHPTALWLAGIELRAHLAASVMRTLGGVALSGGDRTTVGRVAADMEVSRPLGDTRWVARTVAAAVSAHGPVPAQELVYTGGPITAPGYDFHSLVGNAALAERLELQVPAPFLSVSLGRFGRSPATMTLAPFVAAVALRRPDLQRAGVLVPPQYATRVIPRASALYPSVGLGALLFFDILRFDAARGLRDGRWSFYVDVNRAFWSVL